MNARAKSFIYEHCHETDSSDTRNPFGPDKLSGDPSEFGAVGAPLILSELELAIDSSREESSPGLDQVDNKMIRNSLTSFIELLLQIINQFLLGNQFHHS